MNSKNIKETPKYKLPGQYIVRDYNTGAEFVSSVSQIKDAVRHYNDELDDGEWRSIYDRIFEEEPFFIF